MTFDQAIAIANVLVSAAGPLAVVVIAFIANKRIKHFETRLEEQRRVSDTRFKLYQDIGFKLNDLYAYFLFVGNWKALSPQDIIEHKRELDRFVYTYRPIFSNDFHRHYHHFIYECFKSFGGWGTDARLRTTSVNRPNKGPSGSHDCFTEEDNREATKKAYNALLNCLASDLGLDQLGRAT